jgi:hypothetical protein
MKTVLGIPPSVSLPNRYGTLGALVLLAAGGVLLYANMVPFVRISELAEMRSYTILGGVIELYQHGDALLGGTIFVFSFLFPFAKLGMLLLATGFVPHCSATFRGRVLAAALWFGKYSMLDVFVGALMIVVTRRHDASALGSLFQVKAGPGVLLFLLAWLLSLLAGYLILIAHGGQRMVVASGFAKSTLHELASPKGRFGPALIGAVALVVGLTFVALAPAYKDVALVTAIRLIAKPALTIHVLPQRQHDLYLEVRTPNGVLRTPTQPKAVIGNGVTMVLPRAVLLRDIQSISVWDARESTLWGRLHHPEQLDRVDELEHSTVGARFCFRLHENGTISPVRWMSLWAGYFLLSTGSLLMIWAVIMWSQRRGT